MTEVLREEWGFEGYTYSDWEAIDMFYTFHKTADSLQEAGRQAIEAGMDVEAPQPVCFGRRLLELVQNDAVSMSTIDTAVRRVLRAKFLLGLFENPYCGHRPRPRDPQLPRASRARAKSGAEIDRAPEQ